MKIYTGIGSRETPLEILSLMEDISRFFSFNNWHLRSGGAIGADSAFENFATRKTIFLPWNGFNNKFENDEDYIVPPFNSGYIRKYHPKFNKLSTSALKLMSRNTYQVLGEQLNKPSDVIICWTKDGKDSGGTGQALRIAKDHGIEIINLYHYNSFELWKEMYFGIGN